MENQSQYTDTVGKKFNPDGSVRLYPGVTVICFAEPDSEIFQNAASVQNQLTRLSFADSYSLLLPDSFHMTVFDLILSERRELNYWSADLPLAASLEEIDQFFMARYSRVDVPDNFQMRVTGLGGGRIGLSLSLVPANTDTYRAIWQFRHGLAEVTGVRHPDFETYQFHLSLAYRIRELTPVDELIFAEFLQTIGDQVQQPSGVFDTGTPYLTFFDDMFRFVKREERLTLKSRSV